MVTHPVPCKGTHHRWIVGKLVNDVIMSGVQTLVIKSDQEASVMDVKNALMRELRSVEGFKVMLEESQVGASAANAVVVRSVWEMRSTARSLIAYAEWVHNTSVSEALRGSEGKGKFCIPPLSSPHVPPPHTHTHF